MSKMWKCLECNRKSIRKNQKHAYGIGDREHVIVTVQGRLSKFTRVLRMS